MSSATSAGTTIAQTGWTPPKTIEAISVYTDRYTDPSTLDSLPSKETDPSRMGIYVCLLDDRPHLHPNLAALHKHRLVVHSIPSPLNPNTDLPSPQGSHNNTKEEQKQEWFTWKYSEEEELRRRAYLPLE